MPKLSPSLLEFVTDNLPAAALRLFELVASLDYPINDSTSLKAAASQDNAAAGLASLFEPCDFPLASTRNALDKLAVRVPRQLSLTPAGTPIHAHLVPSAGVPIDLSRLPPRITIALEAADVCRRECDSQLSSCIDNAGENLVRIFDCIKTHRQCLRGCG